MLDRLIDFFNNAYGNFQSNPASPIDLINPFSDNSIKAKITMQRLKERSFYYQQLMHYLIDHDGEYPPESHPVHYAVKMLEELDEDGY